MDYARRCTAKEEWAVRLRVVDSALRPKRNSATKSLKAVSVVFQRMTGILSGIFIRKNLTFSHLAGELARRLREDVSGEQARLLK
jgi:hypothetical protein